MNWKRYPNFTQDEFRCKHTGKCKMDQEFMTKLQALRTELQKPLTINSGYRDPSHPIEAKKKNPGEHSEGKASDISAFGELAYQILTLAPKHGFTRIGIQQKGPHNSRYIHLGTSKTRLNPTIWSY